MRKNPKLIDKWSTHLPPDAHSVVRVLASLADSHGFPLYLVGGPVRDLLLGHSSLDIDLAVEGDATMLASELAAHLGLTPKVHAAFGTATIPGHGWRIDLATARSETYRHPGALPRVTPAAIQDDLRRRDFTINAMALRLNGPGAGGLLDPAGGEADLRRHLIRALHERSFQDDATRILRAVRYAVRFGFSIESRTLKWLHRDVSYLGAISPARLHHEFARIFAEVEPECALLELDRLGALHAIHPALRFTPAQANGFREVRSFEGSPHPVYWPLLIWPDRECEAAVLCKRLALTNRQRETVLALPVNRDLPSRLVASARMSEVAAQLAAVPPAAARAIAAMAGAPARRIILDYLERGRHIKPVLNGDDVIALGVPRGPEVGDVLRRLRIAKLDGEVRTRKDEERFVRNLLAGAGTR